MLERDEYIEQAYFFRTYRERLTQNLPAQEVLAQIGEEILSTTQLPHAISFMLAELKHHGAVGPAMARVAHYFAPFQAFVMMRAEDDRSRFDLPIALKILEREAEYRAGAATGGQSGTSGPSVPQGALPDKPAVPPFSGVTPQGLFVYQFECISRNRLGYDAGLAAIAGDPMYDEAWREWIGRLRSLVGTVDFADLLYARSAYAVVERRRQQPDYEPSRPVLFGEKEGKIARANRGKDPLYLFAALQRHLGYPAVPRSEPPDPMAALVPQLERRVQQLETRLKLVEEELKGAVDLSQFYVKPERADEEASDRR